MNLFTKKYSIYMSFIFFAFCLILPGYFTDNFADSDEPSVILLLFGFLGVGSSLANSTWLANPLLFLSWYAIEKKWKICAIISAMTALAFAVSFSFATTLMFGSSPVPAQITGLGAGYWLWVASMAMALLASLLMPDERNAEEEDTDDTQN